MVGSQTWWRSWKLFTKMRATQVSYPGRLASVYYLKDDICAKQGRLLGTGWYRCCWQGNRECQWGLWLWWLCSPRFRPCFPMGTSSQWQYSFRWTCTYIPRTVISHAPNRRTVPLHLTPLTMWAYQGVFSTMTESWTSLPQVEKWSDTTYTTYIGLFATEFGFDENQTVALMGAHTLGQVSKHAFDEGNNTSLCLQNIT